MIKKNIFTQCGVRCFYPWLIHAEEKVKIVKSLADVILADKHLVKVKKVPHPHLLSMGKNNGHNDWRTKCTNHRTILPCLIRLRKE